jgi:hypothetical protein
MSARIIVSLGVGALLLVLIGTLAFGDAVGFYLIAAGGILAVVAIRALVRRRGEPPGGAFAGR